MSRPRRCQLATSAVLIAVAIALPTPVGAPAQGPACGNVDRVPTSRSIVEVRRATLCLLNDERARAGLAPLRDNRELRKAAQSHSRKMVRLHFFDHRCPQGSTLRSRVRGTSYLRGARDWALAENLGWGSGRLASPREIVGSWMRSAGHRENILDPRFRDIGIGIAPGAPANTRGLPAGTYTTDFGTRKFA